MESLDMEHPSLVVCWWRAGRPARPSTLPEKTYRPLAEIRLIRSRTRQEYPHSLSYHEITLTQLPATTRVMGASTMEERESPLKSDDTSSFSSNPRYPLSGPDSEAFFRGAFTSSRVVFFSTNATRSTTETLGVGTRIGKPPSLPARWGGTGLSVWGEIEEHLIVGVRVDGRHGAADDLEVVVHDLGDRAKTIRGAGSVRDDVVPGGIVLLFVHAEHDGQVFVLCGGGDDDFFHAASEMFPGVVGVGEVAGGLDDDLSSNGIPGQGSGIFFFKNFDDFAVDRNTVGAGGDFVRQVAEDRVVLQQMGKGLRVGEIVYSYKVEVLVGERGAKNVASDAPKSIYTNFYCHDASERDFDCLKKNTQELGTNFDGNRVE